MVLALLASGPMHGYGLRQIANKIIGPYRNVAWGPLYATLRRLKTDGLIELVGETSQVKVDECHGGPPSKRYQLTAAGRQRFVELMGVPEEPEPEYDVTMCLKIARLGHIPPAARLEILRDYAEYCRTHIAHLSSARDAVEAADLVPDVDRPWILLTMHRRIELWHADLAWIERLLDGVANGRTPDLRHGSVRDGRSDGLNCN
jgi:DNA-binding PadR family transcriptional regulator